MNDTAAASGPRLSRMTVFAWLIMSTPLCYGQHIESACLGADIHPQYPPLNAAPLIEAQRTEGMAGAPIGAPCFGPTRSAAMWIAVSGVVRTDQSQNEMVRKFGAISELLSAKYWSTTERKWRPLVSAAAAIPGAHSTQSRGDYSLAELAASGEHYYLVTDSRSGHPTPYQLWVRQPRPDRIVVETSNVDALKEWGITVYAAGGLETLYFLEQRSPGVWAYYSITRILPANFLAQGHEKSYINRAVALYRHYMRLPTEAEPPAAP